MPRHQPCSRQCRHIRRARPAPPPPPAHRPRSARSGALAAVGQRPPTVCRAPSSHGTQKPSITQSRTTPRPWPAAHQPPKEISERRRTCRRRRRRQDLQGRAGSVREQRPQSSAPSRPGDGPHQRAWAVRRLAAAAGKAGSLAQPAAPFQSTGRGGGVGDHDAPTPPGPPLGLETRLG